MEYPPGWTCEVTVVSLERYLLGRLAWSDTLSVAEHMEACPECAQRLVLTSVSAMEIRGTGRRG